MGKRKGILCAAVQRFNTLMADGEKRSEAKAVAREAGKSRWTFTDGKIHAFESRENYQKIAVRFIQWARAQYEVNLLEELDERADELVSFYLTERIIQNYSTWTLQTEKSALRTFFGRRSLASEVILPRRKRENIKRSRLTAIRDRHFQPANWQAHISFLAA